MQNSFRPARRGFSQNRRSFAPRSFNSRSEFYGKSGRSRRGSQSSIDPAKLVRKASGTVEVAKYEPKNSFADFHFDDRIQANLLARGYVDPTPIQDQAIPHVLEGKDVVGIANTGTGKTAAFLLPLLHKMTKIPNQRVLIILPTRELANQVESELKIFCGSNMKVFSALCVGGMSIGRQISDLRRNPNFVIGTPGRLKDLMNRRALDLRNFNNIVLDEVDRMLDMGFVRDIKTLIEVLPANRQSMFFSATINPEAEGIMRTLLQDPITISVKTAETAANVDQDIIRVKSPDQKMGQLLELLQDPNFAKVLIFGHTKHGVEKLGKNLSKEGFKVVALHGDKSQPQRQRALDAFKKDQAQILVATDVAARGLDIPNVTHVINYEMPNSYSDYVHRIGRTGRASQKGFALTFVG